jgi:7,8-dihydropterin-6-yl-methyl-4-(beta-D-ribofuranosyl)aminobenzene 5'-phosphate synthase
MKLPRILSLSLLIFSFQYQVFAQDLKILDNQAGLSEITATNGIEKPVTVKVIYDNYTKVEGLEADWGYSIVIEGLDKEILFDAGTKPEIFASNFRQMGLDAGKIDLIVFSHEHGDHTAGLSDSVKIRKDISVLIPFSFSDPFKKKMISRGFTPLIVREPARICNNMFTSGEFPYRIPEQALVLNTPKGLVVMTGCCHPGIVEMLKKIRSDFNKNIYMVFGGFHLLDKSEKEMNVIISEIKNIGVVKCGATHCTGDSQIKMFKEAFGDNYIELGVGNSLIIN